LLQQQNGYINTYSYSIPNVKNGRLLKLIFNQFKYFSLTLEKSSKNIYMHKFIIVKVMKILMTTIIIIVVKNVLVMIVNNYSWKSFINLITFLVLLVIIGFPPWISSSFVR